MVCDLSNNERGCESICTQELGRRCSPVCPLRVAAGSNLSPRRNKRANARPIPETFAAETSGKPSANVPSFVCRCWRARVQSRCSIAVHWRFDNGRAACRAQRSVVGRAPDPRQVVNRSGRNRDAPESAFPDLGHKTEWQLGFPVTSERSSEPLGNRNGSPPDRESRAPLLESPKHDASCCPTGYCGVAGRTCAECRAAPSAPSPEWANAAENPRQWESPRQRTSPVLAGSTSLNKQSDDCHSGPSRGRTSVVLPPGTEEYGSALNPDATGAAFLDGALTGRLTASHRKDHSSLPKDESPSDS